MSMKPSELQKLLSSDQQLQLYDVRTEVEYNRIHLSQAISVPLDLIEGKHIEETFDKGKRIVLICKSGARSQKALERLKTAGYEDVDFVEGGTDQCHEEGMDVDRLPRLKGSVTRWFLGRHLQRS